MKRTTLFKSHTTHLNLSILIYFRKSSIFYSKSRITEINYKIKEKILQKEVTASKFLLSLKNTTKNTANFQANSTNHKSKFPLSPWKRNSLWGKGQKLNNSTLNFNSLNNKFKSSTKNVNNFTKQTQTSKVNLQKWSQVPIICNQ